jgi:hypothetical protein
VRAELVGDLAEPICRFGGRGGGEDPADRAGDQRLLRSGDVAEHVSEEMHGAALPGQPSTCAIAAFKPWWASEMHSRTPSNPLARSDRRNSRQNASVSASPTARPMTSRRPLWWTP